MREMDAERWTKGVFAVATPAVAVPMMLALDTSKDPSEERVKQAQAQGGAGGPGGGVKGKGRGKAACMLESFLSSVLMKHARPERLTKGVFAVATAAMMVPMMLARTRAKTRVRATQCRGVQGKGAAIASMRACCTHTLVWAWGGCRGMPWPVWRAASCRVYF
jgi:hypothetical protein